MDTSPLKNGYCLSLSGALASNGKTAQLAHQIWQENVNKNGKLLGRPVELVCLDDRTNPNLVADIYRRLLDVEKVDLVIGGYGQRTLKAGMAACVLCDCVERKRDAMDRYSERMTHKGSPNDSTKKLNRDRASISY